jgi:hypothetical protein
MLDWEVKRNAGTCLQCGVELARQEHFRSGLYHEQAGLDRRDFCESCWPEASGLPFSHWRAQPPATQPKPKAKLPWEPTEAREVLSRLLRGPGEELDPPVAYLFALLVVRKRLARLDQVEHGPRGESLLVRFRGDETPFEVPVTVPAGAEGEARASRRLQELVERFEPQVAETPEAPTASQASH